MTKMKEKQPYMKPEAEIMTMDSDDLLTASLYGRLQTEDPVTNEDDILSRELFSVFDD